MNVCEEKTKIAGSQFRTKNKQNQNRNHHAVFCPKKNFFQLNISFQYFSTGSPVTIKEKKTHTQKKQLSSVSFYRNFGTAHWGEGE